MSLWICDVNGVLIDSIAIMRQAFRATAERCGFTFTDQDFREVSGLSLGEAYRRLTRAADARECQDLHLRYVRDRIPGIQAYPHVRETLAAAKAAGVSVGAVTSFGEIAEACLVRTGLYSFIDCLVTQEEVREPKPNPESILLALSLMGGEKSSHALYVGDTLTDITAGKAAGVRTIGVSYGASTEEDIRAARPAYVISSFLEMRSHLVPSLTTPLRPDSSGERPEPGAPPL